MGNAFMNDPMSRMSGGNAPERPNGAACKEDEFVELRRKLRDALPPLTQPELRRDLWPEMLRRMKQRPVRVPWFDWALLAVAGAALAFFPRLIPALLYHL
jgi:hypothetical protein